MRRSRTHLLGLGLLLLAACDDSAAAPDSVDGELQAAASGAGEQSRPSPAGDARNSANGADARRDGEQGVRQLADAGAPAVNLVCPQGGNSGPVAVVFACDRVTVVTCKDLSNVVLELDDGSRQRLEGLKGHQNAFASSDGRPIVRVWVKAGANFSGDGPGYGERFDAPAGGCADGGTPPPQNPPATPPQDPPPSEPPPSEPPPGTPVWLD